MKKSRDFVKLRIRVTNTYTIYHELKLMIIVLYHGILKLAFQEQGSGLVILT